MPDENRNNEKRSASGKLYSCTVLAISKQINEYNTIKACNKKTFNAQRDMFSAKAQKHKELGWCYLTLPFQTREPLAFSGYFLA